MANPQHFPRLQNDFEKLKKATLLVISWAIVTGGAPTAILYPPATVRGVWGEDVLLQFAINGTQPQSSIVLQGPNPQTGSDNLQHIFERGTGELDPHQPFEDNFTVSIVWSEGVTFLNLTIHNLQNKVVGKYRLSMTVHFTGADINVYGWNGAHISSTPPPPKTSPGTSYWSTNAVSGPGSTQGSGGLKGGYIALIVLAIGALLFSVAIIGLCFYKRRTSGARQQVSKQGEYDHVKTFDPDHQDNVVMPGTPEAQELNDMSNRDREIGGDDGSPDSAHSNGPVPV